MILNPSAPTNQQRSNSRANILESPDADDSLNLDGPLDRDGTNMVDPMSLRTGYLLVCEATSESLTAGSWRFNLETADGGPVFEASDADLGDLNRLTLLAAVRGLESIDGPANVTLVSNNRYLIRSLSDSLPRWRENDFVWEHFGRRIDVQHADLWRRIDRALAIHRVEAVLVCSRLVSQGIGAADQAAGVDAMQIRVDLPHSRLAPPKSPAGRRSAGTSRPDDSLRRWLIGSSSATPVRTAKNRFFRRRIDAVDLIPRSIPPHPNHVRSTLNFS